MKNILFILLISSLCTAQSSKLYRIHDDEKIALDGKLNESIWQNAEELSGIKMLDPVEGGTASFKTMVKIASDGKNLYLGIKCFDPEPKKIISISKTRDAALEAEDRIKFVFDTHLDGRTGYIFDVNPFGTRYDALISNFGEGENASWDANWEVATSVDEEGWNAEIVIPIRGLSYSPDLKEWGFNFERRVQRLLETDRWAGIKRDFKIGHVLHAGRLTELKGFDNGLGIFTKLSTIGSIDKVYDSGYNSNFDLSADISQKIKDINVHVTLNTDFAETEVDTRQTNLTRFPLFFPEKRSFFLEGADIFDFGIGLGSDVVPFFSRRIGLFNGYKVPILFGSKINGKIDGTSFGVLFTRTNDVEGIVPMSSMGVVRIRQNILEESSIGLIGTFGDPNGVNDEKMVGADFTFHTSKLFGDKNFLVGLWGLYNKSDFKGENSAYGMKIDYPNDILDMAFTALRIGENFSPSIGFVPRSGIKKYSLGVEYMPRPETWSVRRLYFESNFTLITDLEDRWQNWSIFLAPINVQFESGDRFEFNLAPEGENLPVGFEISDGVILDKGEYNWWRYRLELETATKRIINGQATWWFGSFYDGLLDQLQFEFNLRPSNAINVGITYERNIARLPKGNFTQDLLGFKIQLGLSSNLELSSFIQYDSDSKSLGTNSRLRWMYSMYGDLFFVYNHSVNKLEKDIWRFDSNQMILKFSYGITF